MATSQTLTNSLHMECISLTASTAGIDITNGSLDIQISSVYVNSVITSVTGGSLPNTTNSSSIFATFIVAGK